MWLTYINEREDGAPVCNRGGSVPRLDATKGAPDWRTWRGGTWKTLRELARLVNAEIREARDLVDSVSR